MKSIRTKDKNILEGKTVSDVFVTPHRGTNTHLVNLPSSNHKNVHSLINIVHRIFLPINRTVLVLFGGPFRFVPTLLRRYCKAFFRRYIGRRRMPDTVRGQITILQSQTGLFTDRSKTSRLKESLDHRSEREAVCTVSTFF